MNVGVVGLGAIGRAVCRALDEGISGLRLSGATARDRQKAERFLKGLRSPAPFLSLDDLIDASGLVVEASTQAHLDEIVPTCAPLTPSSPAIAAEGTRIRQRLAWASFTQS